MFLKNVALLAATLTFTFVVPLAAQNALPPSQTVLDLSALDKTVDPCVDFYTYSCGGWMKNNPVPPDQSNWGTYGKLQRRKPGAIAHHPRRSREFQLWEGNGYAEDWRLLRLLHG